LRVFFKDESKCLKIESSLLPSNPRMLQSIFNVAEYDNLHLGIDGSTSSFGLAWFKTKANPKLLMFSRSKDQFRKEFMSELFPFLQLLFSGMSFITATYERTPDDFTPDSKALRVMKETERSVKNFLESEHRVEIKNTQNIFGVFPGSWKAYMVPTDTNNNSGKKDKRLNSIGVLSQCRLDVKSYLYELDDSPSEHSYDCIEALGLAVYGSEFIKQGPLITTYRNFKRRRPLIAVAVKTIDSALASTISTLKTLSGGHSMCMFTPNRYHSILENLYALDSDEALGLLLVPTDSPLRFYFEFVFNAPSMKMSWMLVMVMRYNEESIKVIAKFRDAGLITHVVKI